MFWTLLNHNVTYIIYLTCLEGTGLLETICSTSHCSSTTLPPDFKKSDNQKCLECLGEFEWNIRIPQRSTQQVAHTFCTLDRLKFCNLLAGRRTLPQKTFAACSLWQESRIHVGAVGCAGTAILSRTGPRRRLSRQFPGNQKRTPRSTLRNWDEIWTVVFNTHTHMK